MPDHNHNTLCVKCCRLTTQCICSSACPNTRNEETVIRPIPVFTRPDISQPFTLKWSWECHRCRKVNAPHMDQCTCQAQ